MLQALHNRENTNEREDTSFGILTRGHAGSGAPPLTQVQQSHRQEPRQDTRTDNHLKTQTIKTKRDVTQAKQMDFHILTTAVSGCTT